MNERQLRNDVNLALQQIYDSVDSDNFETFWSRANDIADVQKSQNRRWQSLIVSSAAIVFLVISLLFIRAQSEDSAVVSDVDITELIEHYSSRVEIMTATDNLKYTPISAPLYQSISVAYYDPINLEIRQ